MEQDARGRREEAVSTLRRISTPPGHRPVALPPDLEPRVDSLTDRLAAASTRLDRRVDRDGMELLVARVGTTQRHTPRRVSMSGQTRLFPCRDGWAAVTLSRSDDRELVPALLEETIRTDSDDEIWEGVGRWCHRHTVEHVVGRGVLLGLAVAGLDEAHRDERHRDERHRDERRPDERHHTSWVDGRDADGAIVMSAPSAERRLESLSGVRVVDLSALWAGPLCGALLAAAGADVVKVESSHRRDGARIGSPQLFGALNDDKRHLVVDLQTTTGVDELRRSIATADVVIEASRPRALAQFGVEVPLDGGRWTGGDGVWLSITAHGYRGDAGRRIGFGDDAAVAGGLVVALDDGPSFCGDAIADPLTGLTAAVIVMELLAQGGNHHIDLSMAAVARRATRRCDQDR